MRAVALALLATTVTVAQSLPIVIITRGTGAPLPAAFLREAAETAKKHGGEPWVIAAHQYPDTDAWALDLYLAPVQPVAAVRRGTVISIRAGFNRGRRKWTIMQTASYAHVPLPVQHPFEVRSERDVARPFALLGELSDHDILSVVEFLRSRPRYRGAGGERTVGHLPLQWLTHTGDGQI